MSKYKLAIAETIVPSTALAVSYDLNIGAYESGAIGVKYGAGSGGNAYVMYSTNGTDYSQDVDSIVAMDTGGGYIVWNFSDVHAKYMRIIVPASAATVVDLNGIYLRGN